MSWLRLSVTWPRWTSPFLYPTTPFIVTGQTYNSSLETSWVSQSLPLSFINFPLEYIPVDLLFLPNKNAICPTSLYFNCWITWKSNCSKMICYLNPKASLIYNQIYPISELFLYLFSIGETMYYFQQNRIVLLWK